MAFAIDPGRDTTAYALTDAELTPCCSRCSTAPRRAKGTGRCLID